MKLLALAAASLFLTSCAAPHVAKKQQPATTWATPAPARVRIYKSGELLATCVDVTESWKLSGCVVQPGHDLDEVLSAVFYQLEVEKSAAEDQTAPDCSMTRTRFKIVRM